MSLKSAPLLKKPTATQKSLALLLLHQLAALGARVSNNLFLDGAGNYVVMRHFHMEAAAALRHGSEVGTVRQHFGHWDLSAHNGLSGFVVHALDAPAAAIHVAHDGAGELVRYG